MQGIRHVAHTLKSSSASIGALALARLCAEIETSVRAEAFAALPDRLDAMDRELAAVLQAVTPMLSPTACRHDPARRASADDLPERPRVLLSTTTRSTCC